MRRWYRKHDRPPVPARQTLADRIRQWYRYQITGDRPLTTEEQRIADEWEQDLPWRER